MSAVLEMFHELKRIKRETVWIAFISFIRKCPLMLIEVICIILNKNDLRK